MWSLDLAFSGPCRASTAAGPFACATAAGPFRSLVAVPGQPGVLLAAGSDLARSADGGASWSTPPGFVADTLVAADPTTAGAVYGTTTQRFMRSVDGGLTWATASQNTPCLPDSTRASAPGILVDPSVGGRVYSRTVVPGNPLCRSDDGGVTWAPVTWPAAALGELPSGSPTPGVAITAAGALVAGSPAGAQRSTDGGLSWSRVADLGERVVGPVAAAGSTVYAGTDGRGVFVSDDGGVSWRHASAGLPSMPLAGTLFLLTPGSDVVYGGLRDELLRSDDGGATWLVRASGGALAIDPLALDPVDGTLFAHATSRSGGGGRLAASTDGGLSFTTLAQGAPFAQRPLLLHASRSRPRVLMALSAGSQLWRSTDDGRSWRLASRLRPIVDVAFDAADPQRIAALVRVPGGQVLYATTNGGTSWRRAVPGNANETIDADPVVGGRFWLTQAGGLLRRSTDGGRTFARQPGVLAIGSLAFAGRTLVATMETDKAMRRPGLFRSLPANVLVASSDNGRSWTVVDAPLPARLGVTVGGTMLLAEGPNGIVLRTPLPLATARLVQPPRILGSARTGQTLRCQAARLAGSVIASTTAVGLSGNGPVGGTTYRVPRSPGFSYACHTVARTPLGLVLASSRIVRAPGTPPGGGGAGGEGGG